MKTKRFLAFALALIMALGCMGFTAFAEGTPTTTDIKYLEPTYNNNDYTKGLSGWEVVEKKDVTIATASTDFSAGGWFAVTGYAEVDAITTSNDLNIYIQSGANLIVPSITATGKTVTFYGDGMLNIDTGITADTIILNGCNVMICGFSAGTAAAGQNGDNGKDAITGNVILNGGSGEICGGAGGNVANDEGTEGLRGGDNALAINGLCHVNGGSFCLQYGSQGIGDEVGGPGKDNGVIAEGTLTLSDGIILKQGDSTVALTDLIYLYDFNVIAEAYYVVADTTISDKLTITSGTAPKYASGATVNPTVTAQNGYLFDKLYANGTEVTKNTSGKFAFTMPEKNVLLTATYTPGAFLDLEASDNTYPDKTTVEQKYTLTQTGETTYNDKTKVKVEWVLPEISASFTQAKTWNPDTMQWDENKNTADIGQKQAKFTFTNYSSVKVGAQVSFAKSIGTDTNPYKSDVYVMDTMVNDDAGRTLKSSASTIAIITHDYTPIASEFNALSAGSGTYGTYTLRLIYVYKVTFNMKGHGDAVDTQYIVSGEKVTAPTPEPSATNYIFGGWYKEEGCTTPWNFTDDTVTADTVLYAKWSSNTYTVTLVPGHGKENSSVIATNGQAMPTLQGDQIPYDTAYEFLGYFDQQEGGNRYYNADGTSAQNYNLTTDTTLYAQWKELGQPE